MQQSECLVREKEPSIRLVITPPIAIDSGEWNFLEKQKLKSISNHIAFHRAKWEKLCATGDESATFKQWNVGKGCGRPLGPRFDRETGESYIADAYFGPLVAGPKGGLATSLAAHADGKPILFANDFYLHSNGPIFFTDTTGR
ncbi:Protein STRICTOSIDINE SYNTHASE-LIKE 13 [Ancistrocladus abbreviatus]